MRREPLKYLFFGIAGLLAAVELWLLLSGNRILLNEEYVPEQEAVWGVTVRVEYQPAKYECTYFTGRKKVFEELSAGQYDECPFIWNEG